MYGTMSVAGPQNRGKTSQNIIPTKNVLPKKLGKRLLGYLNEKQKTIPLRNKIYLERSTKCILRGRKKKISRHLFDQALDYEFNQLKQNIGVSWVEKYALKNFIMNTMTKMYIVV